MRMFEKNTTVKLAILTYWLCIFMCVLAMFYMLEVKIRIYILEYNLQHVSDDKKWLMSGQ